MSRNLEVLLKKCINKPVTILYRLMDENSGVERVLKGILKEVTSDYIKVFDLFVDQYLIRKLAVIHEIDVNFNFQLVKKGGV